MIIVITHEKDAHGAHMIKLLNDLGARVKSLNYKTYPQQLEISLKSGKQGEKAILHFPDGETIEGAQVKSILNRRQKEPEAPEGIRDTRITDYIVRESRNVLDALPQALHCFWLSNPDAVRIASRKPHQAIVASKLGFLVPPTLVTNSPTEVVHFLDVLEGDVACKALWTSGITIRRDNTEKGIALYTQRLKKAQILERLENIKNCPLILQPYIEKEYELRITVVGKKVFACEIGSQHSERTKEDWRRYDLKNTPHKEHKLPSEIEGKCIKLVEELSLQFGAIDMIVTPEGEYVFLEINPNGQWLWIEHLTKMPISQAIADLLANPPQT